MFYVSIPGGQPGNPWRQIPIPQDGRRYRLDVAFAGGAQTARVDMLTFPPMPNVTTAPKVLRSFSWPAWQRDAVGRLLPNLGEAAVSLRWYGSADQTLSVAVYPIS